MFTERTGKQNKPETVILEELAPVDKFRKRRVKSEEVIVKK